MSLKSDAAALFSGFSKLSLPERYSRLIAMGALTEEEVAFLQLGGIKDTQLADKLIENVIGYFQLPLGVASNVRIDDEDYVIPMAVEETSIVAALSKTAKWIRQSGHIKTEMLGQCVLGQIQIARVTDFARFSRIFNENKQFFIEKVNEEVAFGMVRRGGGVKDITLRHLIRADDGDMAVIHLTMDCCDAMGANILNQVLEYLKAPIQNMTGEEVSMCILSNLNDQKLTKAVVTINNVEEEFGQRIEEASLFAEMDPYRAATHNKGVMNGIDPVVIATGNDWRAIEAGVHAYAARSGRYQAITRWRYQNNTLTGEFLAPLVVGIIGGVTGLHPTAKLCLKMMGVQSANQLSRVLAAVGLMQNLGAIKALTTEGIIQGHMKLHLDNLLLAAGANEAEMGQLRGKLASFLHANKRVSVQQAVTLLSEIRGTP